MTTKKTKHPSSIGESRIERYYSKIVIGFVVVAVGLIGLIVYFSFTKTTIIITTSTQDSTVTIEAPLSALGGTLVLTDVSGSYDYTDIKGTTTKTGKASGTVTLYNNYSTDQPLVKTTRLLSDTGVLFRTQETVTVPAGGEIDVPVAADQEGIEGNISPSTFEIVALWEGLKDKIYGKSTEAMTGGITTVGIVSDSDIANAIDTATSLQLSEGVQRVITDMPNREELAPYTILGETEALVIDTKNRVASAAPGDTVEKISITQDVSVAVPLINANTTADYIAATVKDSVQEGMALANDRISLNDIGIDVISVSDNSNQSERETMVSLRIPVQLRMSAAHPLLQTKELINKTEQEVRNYFAGIKEIQSVEVSFSPFWLKRTPAVPGNITVDIQ